MKKVFITRRLPGIAKETLLPFFEVEENKKNEPLSSEYLKEIVSRYEGILSTIPDKFTKQVLENAKGLKVISNYAVGLDNIDLEFAKTKGIAVFNTPDVVTESTADLTFALLLALIRKIPQARQFVKDDKWRSWDPELFLGEELNGKILGIMGYGRIGKAVAKRALGFGLKVMFYNRPAPDEGSLLAKPVELEELLKNSDYISVHLPLTDETRGIINLDMFRKMAKKPVILNIARGPIVDTNGLIDALKQGLIRGAALDVVDPEPISGRHPLCGLENCLIVPHIGTATSECRYNMAKLAAQNIIDCLGLQNAA